VASSARDTRHSDVTRKADTPRDGSTSLVHVDIERVSRDHLVNAVGQWDGANDIE